MARTRAQIHEGKKITLHYRDEHGRDSERTIWPVAIGYHEAVRILAAWCELRRDFRSFRTDRVVDAAYLDEKYPERRDLLAGEMATGAWSGKLRTIPDELGGTRWPPPHSALNRMHGDKQSAAIDAESPCQACGACCSYSSNWPRFTTEDDAALDLIPEKFVNERLSGMRCDGDRCSALSGKVGVATSCGIYAVRPEVCRTCMPGDAECDHGAAPARTAGAGVT